MTIKRRSETFAEAEQRRKSRQIELGILGAGEISGMCELVFNMPTYMQSTRCIESCDVYYIFRRSYERLIAKRNPHCISEIENLNIQFNIETCSFVNKDKMKSNVMLKLSARNSRIPIDLFRSLEYTIRLQQKQSQSPSKQPMSSSATTTSSSSIASPRGFVPPRRGPIINIDSHTYMRPKSRLLIRARQQQLKEEQEKSKLTAIVTRANRKLSDEKENEQVTFHPIVVASNQNQALINGVENLELLENKVNNRILYNYNY